MDFSIAMSVVLLAVLGLSAVGSGLPDVCSYCRGTVRATGLVGERCFNESNTTVKERCCVVNSTSIIGLDLHGCNITTLANNVTIFQELRETIQWIDLSNTSLMDFTTLFNVDSIPMAYLAFQNLTEVSLIVMPSDNNHSCPGPEKSWRNISRDEDLVCENPISACSPQGELVYFRNNSACTKTSICFPNGPGFRRCECIDGYYGYRCLRKGTFPLPTFFISVGAIVLSSIVLSQIYKCKKGNKNAPSGYVQVPDH